MWNDTNCGPASRIDNRSRWILLVTLLTFFAPPVAGSQPTRFFAVGDAPYNSHGLETLGLLLDQAQRARPAFIAHLGDIKGGSSPCDEDSYRSIATLFGRQPVPVAYSPGDNDWTDCRREKAGGHDPLERLLRLRQVFFSQPSVLRLHELPGLTTASQQGYPELFSFRIGRTRFISLHVVGSRDNRETRDPASMNEWRGRSRANRAWLAKNAGACDCDSLVILFHADPGFERQTPHPAYSALLQQLHALSQRQARPILLVHGDSHDFRFDRPYEDRSLLWRLEVPGYPHVAGVVVEVATQGGSDPFKIEYLSPHSEVLPD